MLRALPLLVLATLLAQDVSAQFVEWSAAPVLPAPRVEGSAAVLGGKLYYAGGYPSSRSSPVATVYVLDSPTSTSWREVAPMANARWGLALVAAGGKLWAIGGATGTSDQLDVIESYDPSADSWTTLSTSLEEARREAAAAFFLGRVYVCGGVKFGGPTAISSMISFDPASPSVHTTHASIPVGRATRLVPMGGELLAVGGHIGDTALEFLHRWKPDASDPAAAGSWTTDPSNLRFPAVRSGVARLGDALVVAGGTNDGSTFLQTAVERFNSSSGTWSSATALPSGRQGFPLVAYAGALYAIGGLTGSATGNPTDSVQKARLIGEEFSQIFGEIASPLSTQRIRHGAVALEDGSLLVVGGRGAFDSGSALATAETLTTTTASWQATAGSMPQGMYAIEPVLLDDGRVFIAGGRGDAGPSANLFFYNPASRTFSIPGGTLVLGSGRVRHSTTKMADGRVLIAGGVLGAAEGVTDSAQIFDPQTNGLSSASSLPAARRDHSATLLEDGRILIAGGRLGSGIVTTCLLYNPQTNLWSSAGTMNQRRAEHLAARLADGTVLVAGGVPGADNGSEIELFSPGDNSWTPVTGGTRRKDASLTVLGSGDVVLIGGESSTGFRLDSVDRVSVATRGAFTLSGKLESVRSGHRSLTLTGVQAMIIGGSVQSSATSSAAVSSVERLFSGVRPNRAPVAAAPGSLTARRREQVLLDATGSSDPDGDTLSYTWEKTSGPVGGSLADASSAVASFATTEPGSYQFRVTVTDGNGGSSTASTTVVIEANKTPIAIAGPNQVSGSGGTFQLDGRASSDPDGDALDFAWSKVSGPAVTLTNATSQVATVVIGTQEASYVFELVVTDALSASAAARTTISVTQDLLPIADAGPDRAVRIGFPGSTVDLDGRGSSDPDGTPLAYQWTQVGGTPSQAIVNPTSAVAKLSPTTAGTYVFQLTVSSNGLSASDTMNVTATPFNRSPIARPVGPQLVLVGATVRLDGSTSSDPDGDPLDYEWVLRSGPSSPALTGTRTQILQFQPPNGGTYLFELTVADPHGGSASAQSSVVANTPPSAAAGSDTTVSAGQEVVLDGSRSSDADGDSIALYRWEKLFGPNIIIDGTSTSSLFRFRPEGTGLLGFGLSVTDSRGATGTDQVLVNVVSGNSPPEAKPAVASLVVGPGNPVILDGRASRDPDAGDSIVAYEWTFVKTPGPAPPLSESRSAVASFTPTVEGSYEVNLRVTDSRGATGNRGLTLIVGGGNTPPLAVAGDDRIVAAGRETALDGSRSRDPDGDSIRFSWRQLSGTPVTLAGNLTSSVRFTPPESGIYDLELTVTDSAGASSADTVRVTALAADQLPDTLGEWTTVADMPTPRRLFAAVSLRGKIYTFGGARDNTFKPLGTVEIYNPQVGPFGAWTAAPPMPTPRFGPSAAAVGSRIFVIGGRTEVLGQVSDTGVVEIFDTVTQIWSSGPPLINARSALSAAVLDNRLYATGGLFATGATTAATDAHELFDPLAPAQGWKLDTRLLLPRRPAMASFGDRLVVVGGETNGQVALGRAEIFTPSRPTPANPFASGGTWEATTAERQVPAAKSAAAALGIRIYVAGGIVNGLPTNQVERFDPFGRRFDPIPIAPMQHPRFDLSLVNLNGKLFAIGGAVIDPRTGSGPALNIVERLDVGDDHADSVAEVRGGDTLALDSTLDAAIEEPGDVDFFRISTVQPNQRLQVITGPPTSFEDTVLSLFDPQGTLITTVDDPASGSRLAAATLIATAPGDYLASVRLFDPRLQAQYNIQVRNFVEPQDDVPSSSSLVTTSVALGATVTAAIDLPRDVDFFRVDLDAGRDYVFRTALGSLFDSVLGLFGPGAAGPAPIRENDDADGTQGSRIDFRPTVSGAYFLRVRSFDPRAVGSYSLSVERLPGEFDGDDHPNQPIGLGPQDTLTHEGNELPGDLQTETDFDFFLIRTQSSSSYAFTATPVDPIALQLTIFDRDGRTVLTEARESAVTGGAAGIRAFRPVSGGTYFLRVRRPPPIPGDTRARTGRYLIRSILEGTEEPANITLLRETDGLTVTATVALNKLPSDQGSLQSVEFGLVYNPRLLEVVSVRAGTVTTAGQLLRFASPEGFLGFSVITQEEELSRTGSLVSVTFRSLSSSPIASQSVVLGFVASQSGLTRSIDVAPAAHPGVNRAVDVQSSGDALLPTIIDPIAPAGDNLRPFIRLDGRRSQDPNFPARPLSYDWTLTTGPAPVTLSGAQTAIPTFAPAIPGTYEFALTVRNSTLSSLPGLVRVRVGVDNRPPTALFLASNLTLETSAAPGTAPLTGVAGQNTIQLDGRLSVDPDVVDRQTLTYRWTQVSGPEVALSPSAAASVVSFTPSTPGVYDFELEVTDSRGARSSPLRGRVVVLSPLDTLPVVSVTASASTTSATGADLGELLEATAVDSLRVTLPTRITIKAKVADPDLGTLPLKQLVSYVFRQESGPPVQLSTSGLDNDFTGVAASGFDPTTVGVHVFGVQVSSLTSAGAPTGVEVRRQIRIVVDAEGAVLPTARATIGLPAQGKSYAGRRYNETLAVAGETVVLDGSASSSALGGSLEAAWSQLAGPEVVLSNPFSTVTSFVAPDFGDGTARQYAFQLIVDDATGPSEPTLLSFNVAASSGGGTAVTSATVSYGGGLALIGVPLGAASEGESRMAQQLLEELDATFIVRVAPDGGTNRMRLYAPGFGLSDHALEGNQGYLVSRPAIFKSQVYTGLPWPAGNRTVTLLPGINIVSFPAGVPSTWTAETLAETIDAGNGGAAFVVRTVPDPTEISEGAPGTGRFDVYLPGFSPSPFPLRTGRAYLVRVRRSATITLPAAE